MERILSELPLAIFTTLAPIGAGAFFALALALLTGSYSAEQLRKADKLTFIPLIIAAVGLIASFIHLASPLHALNVINGIGRSSLSNEIVVAGAFGFVALVFCILAAAGKLSLGARKAFSVVVALLAILLTVFIGLAYSIDTIITWKSPLNIVALLGFFLFGGGLLEALLLNKFCASTGAHSASAHKGFAHIARILMILGFILAAIGVIGLFMMARGITTPSINGVEITTGLIPFLIVFIAALVIAAVLSLIGLAKAKGTAPLTLAVILAVVAVFAGRCLFYGLYISVGIQAL